MGCLMENGSGLVFKRSLADGDADDLIRILHYVRERRGLDFKAYQPGATNRRLALRMAALNLPDYPAYYRYLTENNQEIEALIDSLTIKVSRFFRNPFVFEALAALILPRLLAVGPEPIRVWCAGCARGEEPYSLAILFRELLGRNQVAPPIFILGTDIDEQSLLAAREAVYPEEGVAEVKKNLLDRYFIQEQGRYRLHEEIKGMVAFARHDVTTDRPPSGGVFSGYNLILCRNVLIYLKRESQRRVMTTLAGCLHPGGALVLGEAETLPEGFPGFKEILPNAKIFIKESRDA